MCSSDLACRSSFVKYKLLQNFFACSCTLLMEILFFRNVSAFDKTEMEMIFLASKLDSFVFLLVAQLNVFLRFISFNVCIGSKG